MPEMLDAAYWMLDTGLGDWVEAAKSIVVNRASRIARSAYPASAATDSA
jgi:hypothetical protein